MKIAIKSLELLGMKEICVLQEEVFRKRWSIGCVDLIIIHGINLLPVSLSAQLFVPLLLLRLSDENQDSLLHPHLDQ